MSKQFKIPLAVPQINGNEWQYLKECVDTGWVSHAGKFVYAFEEKIKEYTGAKHALACINGTAALHISLVLAGVGYGDEVLVPSLTFIAPVNAVRYVGANPVFMDCDDYLNLDVEKTKEFVEKECIYKNGQLINKTSGKTIKAIIPVHIFGNPVQLAGLVELCKKYKLALIEDATESLGSTYTAGPFKGKMTGTIGEFGCLSFNGNKIITTGGGGMLLTNDDQLAERAGYLTTQAKDDPVRYVHNAVGYNYRLSNLQAAVGVGQLEKLPQFIKNKKENFLSYKQSLANVAGLRLIDAQPGTNVNYWFYSLLIDCKRFGLDRDGLMAKLEAQGIQARPIWQPNHLQKPYQNCQHYKIDKTLNYWKKVLNLPCSVGLSLKEINYVIETIKTAQRS